MAQEEEYQAGLGIDPNVVYPIERPNFFTMGGTEYFSFNGTTVTAHSAKAGFYFIVGSLALLILLATRR